MSKTHRSTPAKRPLREIEAKRNRDQRRQQAELLGRYEARPVFPQPEPERYKP